MLDQAIAPTSSDLGSASTSLLAALTETAPAGCDVAGILPANGPDQGQYAALDGLAGVWSATVRRRQLAAAWAAGVSLGAAGGMIHSPTLMAPLVRHDRAHDHDQTVVTVWSLEPWTAPERLDRGSVAWHRAMLRRAARFADAVVVPTHAMAAELGEIASLRGRVRVIAGAAPDAFATPTDAPGRVRTLGLPDRYVVALGRTTDPAGLTPALRAAADLALDVVFIGDEHDDVTRIGDLAQASGIPERRVHVLSRVDASDRAAVLSGALAVVSASTAFVFPWRVIEGLAVGAPIITAKTPQNEELLADGAYFTAIDDADGIAEALRRLIDDAGFAKRLRVLSADRSRAFSWRDTAERVWQLHAEL